jgi:hypothetical protein
MSSLITQEAAVAALSTTELPGLLKRWMTLQDEMATLNAEIKQRRTTSAALKSMIMRIMETNNLGQLNVSKGAVVRTTRESKESLNNDYLLKHCKEFFGGDDTKAQALLKYLDEHRATKVTSSIRLVPAGDGGSNASK